ncbi:MAG: GMC family oxidoreductase [Trueperaceae bacterium]|nr:GMC family oxidoreductase [Trueperaceae bacterium]
MSTKLEKVDAVVIGVGWTGGILAKELTQAGLKVVGLERGRYRQTDPDFQPPHIHDELRYHVRYDLMQNLSRETLSFRNHQEQTALPYRVLGSFLPGEGLGGAGVHWNGVCWRFLPYDFEIRSQTLARYGERKIPDDMSLQDWGLTYDELEPYFDQFEYTCGISGQAGNLQGETVAEGNPFEGPRQRPYPTPPLTPSYANLRFRQATASLGYHPFMQPAANLSEVYTNPDGITQGACVYCGYCQRFGCESYAKPSALTTVLPVAMASGLFDLRTHCNVIRINVNSSGNKAVSVTYIDAQGQECTQAADIICLNSYVLNNCKLMLVSGIGKPYQPASGTGVVGKNYCYQASTGATVYFEDEIFNTFMGAGALGVSLDDFNGDNFDHSNLDFIHGGNIANYSTGAGPVRSRPVPPNTPKWGSAWKQNLAHYYNRSWSFSTQGSVMPYRSNYLDLDPTYKDVYGLPLLRMTFDWGPNELAMTEFMAQILEGIAKELGADKYSISKLTKHYSIVPYQSTHNTGGTIMGADPNSSVVNPFLQSWDVDNLFIVGAGNFPHNSGYNPTGTVGALAYRAADAIVNNYLAQPGPLY